MPCYYPIKGLNATRFAVACGRCIGCRLARSQQWAVRCVHEAQMHDENCFITLTYRDGDLPKGRSLCKEDFQKFMKRLRSKYEPKRISFFHAGEYSEDEFRPHDHALLFGHDFQDRVYFKKSPAGFPLYRSGELEALWPFGYSTVAELTFESAQYCAKYTLKKVTGDEAPGWYQSVDHETGEVSDVIPEYATMSLRPAIGRRFFEKYQGEIYPDDFVVVAGQKLPPPRFYDRLLEESNPDLLVDLKLKRERKDARRRKKNSTLERLAVREKVKKAMSSLHRGKL